MTFAPQKPPFPAPAGPSTSGADMRRLQFELALDVSGARRPLVDTVRDAARSVGAELVFVLPGTPGRSASAVVRFDEDGAEVFLQVVSLGEGYSITEEAGMEPALLGLARASVELFRRLSADEAVREPLTAT